LPVLSLVFAAPCEAGEEMTLARFAEEVACLPGASPLPLDMFSLAGGSLADEVRVSWDKDSHKAVTRDAARVRIPGISAVELLFPAGSSFTVEDDCSDDSTSYTFDDLSLGIALKPESEFFPPKAGGVDRIVLYQTVCLVVTYHLPDGEPHVEFCPGGGGGAGGGAVFQIDEGNAFEVGSTGVVVESGELTLETTGSSSVPFRIGLGGVRLSFKGENLSFLNDNLAGQSFGDFSIARTGLTGHAVYNPAGDCVHETLFDADDFCFDSLDLDLTENTIAGALIVGSLKPPFFKDHGFSITGCGGERLRLEISIQADGEMRVAFTCPSEDPIHFTKEGIFDLTVKGIDIERSGGGGYRFRVDGDLNMTFLTRVGRDRSFMVPIERLTVSTEGDISLDGGWVRLSTPEKFRFQDAFDVTVRGISFGSSSEGGKDMAWIGLDADISLMDLLPLRGSVRGFRAIWDEDDPLGTLKLEMDGIAIDFRQPDVASFKGEIRWKGNDDPGDPKAKVFRGDVRLDIEAISLSVDAQLTVGKTVLDDELVRYFYVQLFGEFPTGIPIFTGVSLYGLGGLFASGMQPNLGEFEAPLLWYAEQERCPGWTETCDRSQQGTPPPWRIEPGALTFGAGALIGSSDNGYAVHAKATLLVSIPGPLIAFNGKANILKKRGSFSTSPDPVFNAYIVYDPEESFEMGVGVNYELSPVLKIKGDAEAYFALDDPSRWHIYLGRVGGREIEAKVVEIFKAKAFFMIHPEREDLAVEGSQFILCDKIPTPDLAFGAGTGFDEDYSFGPLGVALRALIAAWAGITFDPIHFQGGSNLDGGVELRAFGFHLGIDIGSNLLFQTPSPFLLDGEFKVKLKLPWPLPDPKATVHLRWEEGEDPAPVEPVLKEVQLTARDGSKGIRTILYDDSAIPADFGDPVPLDFVPNLIFNRPMNDETVPKYFGGDLANPSPFLDFVRARCKDNDPYPTSLSYSYHLMEVELSVQPPEAVGAFPEGAAAGEQPQGVWLPEVRTDEDSREGYPSRVLVLYDPNPFSHLAASNLLIDEGGGGGGTSSMIGMAEWLATNLSCVPPCYFIGSTCKCPDPTTYPQVPCTVLPYSVYRIKVRTEVLKDGDPDNPIADATRYAYFQTQGPPLDLTPYVHEVLPENPRRPHFQDYHLAVRFNQGYMDALYNSTIAEGAVICGGTPGLRARILDSSRKVLRGEGQVRTYFGKGPDHVDPVHDGGVAKSPAEVFEERGGGSILDNVLHIPVGPDAALSSLRPGERHIVQVLWQDERLKDDTRPELTPEEKMAGEKVLFEFPFLLSRFRDLRSLLGTFGEPGRDCDWGSGGYRGSFFDLPVDVPDANWTAAEAVVGGLAGFQAEHPGLAAYAARLRDAHPSAAPTAVDDRTLRVWAERVEALVRAFDRIAGADLEIEDTDLPLLREGWERERTAFDALYKLLGFERRREPLPEVAELSVLRRGGEAMGFLLELPEPLDFGRVAEIDAVQDGDRRLRAVKDAAGSRLFLLKFEEGKIGTLLGGNWSIGMGYQADLGGWLTPALRRGDGIEQEGAAICFNLDTDLFR
jgi:hypothetical protein